jgi:hypothetical protein
MAFTPSQHAFEEKVLLRSLHPVVASGQPEGGGQNVVFERGRLRYSQNHDSWYGDVYRDSTRTMHMHRIQCLRWIENLIQPTDTDPCR